jgi:hypothetical protein
MCVSLDGLDLPRRHNACRVLLVQFLFGEMKLHVPSVEWAITVIKMVKASVHDAQRIRTIRILVQLHVHHVLKELTTQHWELRRLLLVFFKIALNGPKESIISRCICTCRILHYNIRMGLFTATPYLHTLTPIGFAHRLEMEGSFQLLQLQVRSMAFSY